MPKKKNPAAVALGRLGGKVRSAAKTKAARTNAKKRRSRAMKTAIVLAALLLTGCAASGVVSVLPPVSTDAAEVVVIREARVVGFLLTYYITLDGIPVDKLENDQHIIMRVTPGTHLIGIAAGGWNGGTVVAQTTAHQRQYFRIDSAPLSTGMRLQSISAETGQALMATTAAR